MNYRNLGQTDIRISAIVFGGWQAGKEDWAGIDDQESIAAHRAAFDAGITTFDTAEAYGAGHSERILAAALGTRRDELTILTKVSWEHLGRDQVMAACERSLANLGTDRIDLYQIHWPAGSFGSDVVAIEETMDALLELKRQGKIRAIGVSNFDGAQLDAATAVGRIDSVQPPYSLLWRHAEIEVRPWCEDHQATLLAYSPLAQGLLTGRFGKGHVFAPGDNRADNKLMQGPIFDRCLAALDKLRPLADAHKITLGQLALAWLIAQPCTVAVTGARSAEQARQNAAAGDVTLDKDTLAAMDTISRTVTDDLRDHALMWKWDV